MRLMRFAICNVHSSMQRVQTRRHPVEWVIGLQVAVIGLYRETTVDDLVAIDE
jgi:hypothetical protein